LVEIGAGKGYWASLLEARGADIICFDKKVPKSAYKKVTKGGPAVLRSQPSSRNLFLSYPDENESMAIECLRQFTGDYIIHVGELIHFGSLSGFLLNEI
jgi:hypothetical protein